MTRPDADLLRDLAANDAAAMEALLERHWQPLVRYAFRLLGRWDAAEDVAQRAFVRLWANRARWSGGSASALLHRIARNDALDALRSPRERAPRSEPAELVEPRAADAELHLRRLAAAARDAIQALPARRREVFLLARESGLSYAQIAEVTGLARQSVANQMSLALRDLRMALAPFLEGGTPPAHRTEDRDAR